MNNEKFGSFIKELRKEKGVTQKELSEVLGITGGAVSKWERGLSFPDITLLTSLSDYFGVTVAELLNGERGAHASESDIDKMVNAAVNAEINAVRHTRKKIKKVLFFISPVLFALCVILQTGYILVMQPHGYEYIYDFLYPLINALAVVSAGIFVAPKFKNPKIKITVFALCVFLMLMNIIFFGKSYSARRSYISTSPNLKNTVTVKVDKKTGGATIYRNTKLLLFAKPKERLESDVNGDIKMQWLEKDICSLVWRDSDKATKAFIATFGDRSNTASYDYIAPSLLGDWMTESGKDIRISADKKGFTVKCDGQSQFFDYSDCKQYGTTALILEKDGIPYYTIALNRDCVIDKSSGIIKKGGTITLCPIALKKTPEYTLFCTTYKGENLDNYKVLDIKSGEFAIKNGVFYISYDGENAVELPYPSDHIIASEKLMKIDREKTVFVRIDDASQHLVISDNGGIDWYEYELERPYSATAIQFIDSKIGFMFEIYDVAMGTARGRISKTVDGGKSWATLFNGIESSNGPVFKTSSEFIFIDESVGFLNMPTASGNDCPLYRTLDGGKTFLPFDIAGNGYDCYTIPTATQDGLELTVSGGSDQNLIPAEKTYISHDGGKNWTEKAIQ